MCWIGQFSTHDVTYSFTNLEVSVSFYAPFSVCAITWTQYTLLRHGRPFTAVAELLLTGATLPPLPLIGIYHFIAGAKIPLVYMGVAKGRIPGS